MENANLATKAYESEETASEREEPADILTLEGYKRVTTAWLNKASSTHSGVSAYDAQVAIETITKLRETLIAAAVQEQKDRTFDRIEDAVNNLVARVEGIEDQLDGLVARCDQHTMRLDSHEDKARELRSASRSTADLVEIGGQNIARLENGLVRTIVVLQKALSKVNDLDANVGLINLAAPIILDDIDGRIQVGAENVAELQRVTNANATATRALRDLVATDLDKLQLDLDTLSAASGAGTGALTRDVMELRAKLVEVFPFLKDRGFQGEPTTGEKVANAAEDAVLKVKLADMLGLPPALMAGMNLGGEGRVNPECPVHGTHSIDEG